MDDTKESDVDVVRRILGADERGSLSEDEILDSGGIIQWAHGNKDEFGIIIPRQTGVFYQHQTGGMSCIQTRIEGIYVGLGQGGFVRSEHPDEDSTLVYMTDELYRWNYCMGSEEYPGTFDRWDSLGDIWEEIDSNLPIEYEEVSAPDGQPTRREGFKWIRVTGADDEKYGLRGGENLVGETVCLLYPNSE